MKEKIVENFNYALNNFDFKKVHQVMEFLDWTWGGKDTIPSIADMLDACRELFEICLKTFLSTNRGNMCSTGGFEISIGDSGSVNIKFVIDNSYWGYEEE